MCKSIEPMCNAKIGEDFDWQPIKSLDAKVSMMDGKFTLETAWNDNRIINLQDDLKDLDEKLNRALRVESNLFALAEKVNQLNECIKALSFKIENLEKDILLAQ